MSNTPPSPPSPPPKRKIEQATYDAIKAYLVSKGAPNECSVCGSNNWTLHDELVSVPMWQEGGPTIIGGPVVPLMLSICNTCFHTVTHAYSPLKEAAEAAQKKGAK